VAGTYFKKINKPDVLEVVIQAVIAVQGMRLSLKVDSE
jgi:hypothetical protein